jgi:hypothetical protein
VSSEGIEFGKMNTTYGKIEIIESKKTICEKKTGECVQNLGLQKKEVLVGVSSFKFHGKMFMIRIMMIKDVENISKAAGSESPDDCIVLLDAVARLEGRLPKSVIHELEL